MTLDDLKRRLAQTRLPDEVKGAGWDFGTNLDYLKSLVDYWQNQFDWRAQEEKINRFPDPSELPEDEKRYRAMVHA